MTAFVEMAKNSEWLAGGTPFLKERGLLMRSEVDAGSAGAGHGVGPPGPDNEEASDGRDPRGAGERRATVEERALPEGAPADEEGPGRDVYKVHRQLGPFPAELEFVYPFTQTVSDGEVTRKQVRDTVSRLRKMGYESVIVCEKRRAEPAQTGG